MPAKLSTRFTVREIVLALAIVAIFVGAFLNCQAVHRALRATQPLSTIGGDAGR
jgi:hypothetical protein